MSFRTVIIEKQSKLSYQGDYLVVRQDGETTKIHLSEIMSIVLHTQQAFISAYLLSELAKQKISFIICDEKHNPISQSLPIYGAHNSTKRITEQLGWGEPIKKRLWQHIVRMKISQQADLLERRNLPEATDLRAMVQEVKTGDKTYQEAQAARIYFQALFGADFSRDRDFSINAALNYGYAILLSMFNRELVAKGYLTQRGICHRNEYNQFNFSCDLMEPFRPIVDQIVADNVSEYFTKETKHTLANLGNNQVQYEEGNYRLSSVISSFVQDCVNVLNKSSNLDEISGFKTR